MTDIKAAEVTYARLSHGALTVVTLDPRTGALS